ncbi:hypothetical protein PG996_007201 [Apiospora saccharicola]|uniref:Uncharacterized protein n=1 Tax=Apiospora saccharicola TaxID=335842 RepID=A0ABR1VDK6_9PEZI
MHPSNPFFNPETHERQERSPGPTSPPPSEHRSTNPFRRAKRTPMSTGQEDTESPNTNLPTRHTDNDCASPDSPTTSGRDPGPDPDPDPDISNLAPTAGTSPSTPMTDSPQESPAAQHGLASTGTIRGPTTPAAGNIPVNIRARRASRRGLNLHVHWGDRDAAASSSATPDPPQDEQPEEQATTPEQPQSPPAGPPPNPPNQPPTAPSAPDPGASQPNNNMYIIQ